jgi:hypothetical protein
VEELVHPHELRVPDVRQGAELALEELQVDRLHAGEPLQCEPLPPGLVLDLVDLPHAPGPDEAHHPET